MALISALDAFSIDAMLPALSMIGEDLGVAVENRIQYVVTALFLGFSAGVMFYGFVADSIGRRKPVIFGFIIYISGSLLCIFATTYPALLTGRVLQGIGAAGPYVLAIAIVRDSYKGEAMARILSLIMIVFIGVPMIAPFLGQGVLLVAEWRMIFVILALYALCMIGWFWYRQPETLRPEHKTKLSVALISDAVVQVLTHPVTFRYVVMIGLLAGAFIAYLSTAQQIFQGMYELGTRFPVVIAALASLLGIGAYINARLVERFGAVTMVRAGAAVVIVTSSIFLAIYPELTELTPLPAYIIYNGVIIFCFAFLFGNTTSIALEPMGAIAGAASSIVNSLSTLIAIAVAALIGSMLDQSVHPIVIGYLIAAVLALLLSFSAPTTTSDEAEVLS